MDPLLIVLGLLAALVGLTGVVVPVLPGLLVVWLATVGTVLIHRADTTGWVLAGVLTALFALGTAATIVLPARQGRQGGASRRSFVLAGVGAVLGFFLLPVLGFLVGALAGLLVGEYQRLGDWREAAGATGQVLRAYGIGVVLETIIGLTMVAIWLVAAFVRA